MKNSRRIFLQSAAATALTALDPITVAAAPDAALDDASSDPAKEAAPAAKGASPFGPDTVREAARALAAKPYAPRPQVPAAWRNLTYDQYRDIRFRRANALWLNQPHGYEAQFLPPGFFFKRGVRINVVEDGEVRSLHFTAEAFKMGPLAPKLPIDDSLGFSGFRLHANVNNPDYKDEFLVFQGASYFRAVARNQRYGLSARGLALDVASDKGEEFPDFIEFWLETPATRDAPVRIYALLDSPSAAGAYRFDVSAGDITVMDVSAEVFPRIELTNIGAAPLTSMFQFNSINRDRFDDFRPAVHDSGGLAMANGAGEWLWRPLSNPERLQVSSFVDESPRGFGLLQRAREMRDFEDFEAEYHHRPSLWVEPKGDWGPGAVTLVEIPTPDETNDNVVAFWRPAAPVPAGGALKLDYRLYWCWQPPVSHALARVKQTRMGLHTHYKGRLAVIDFEENSQTSIDVTSVTIDASVDGKPVKGVVERNPDTGGLRLAFGFTPQDADAIEMRAQLYANGAPITEKWLYRWTK